MNNKISEELSILEGVISEDIDTADLTSSYYPVADARRIAAKIFTKTVVAQTKKITIQLLQATAAAGTGSKNLGSVVESIAPTGGSKLNALVEAQVSDMDINGGFNHVAVKVGSDNGAAVIAGCVLLLGDKRYMP